MQKLKERGGKVIIIDIRDTPASKNLADIFLKIRPGTDGALALGMAKLIIDNGWADMDYVEKYTYGFEQYKALVEQYPLDKVCEITGLDADQVFEATKLYATNGPPVQTSPPLPWFITSMDSTAIARSSSCPL